MQFKFLYFLAWVLCFSKASTVKGNKNISESTSLVQSTRTPPIYHHEPRRIKYKTLMNNGAVAFAMPHSIDTYKALLIDPVNGTRWQAGIYVGARNYVVKFDLSLQNPKPFEIPAAPEQIEKCKAVGKPVDECQNFIKFLEITQIGGIGTIIACGTNAHSPICIALLATSLSEKLRRLNGLTPGNPNVDVAGYEIRDEVYVGISSESRGTTGKILYTTWKKGSKTIRSMESRLWLDEVQFVGAFSPKKDHKFVYFVFREIEIGTQAPLSRVGRVCRQDTGTDVDHKEYFTSFTKAYLVCGDYNQVEGVSYNEGDSHFWATFSITGAPNTGSAICWYRINELEAVFRGSYYRPNTDHELRKASPPLHSPSEIKMVETCYGNRSMSEIKQNTKMKQILYPHCHYVCWKNPHCSEMTFATNVSLNKIATVRGNHDDFVVLAGDELGRVWKMDITDLSKCSGPRTIYNWEVIPPRESSKEINLLSVYDDSLIVLTNKAVMKIPVRTNYQGDEEVPTTTEKRNNESKPIQKTGGKAQRRSRAGHKNHAVKTKSKDQQTQLRSGSKFSYSQSSLFFASISLLTV